MDQMMYQAAGQVQVMDQIRIQDLEVYARHGVYKEENALGQKFLVSIRIDVDLSKPGQTDCIEDSIDYGKICHVVSDFMKQHTFHLIEAAAESLAEKFLFDYDAIQCIWIQIKKPWAPIGVPLEHVSVAIERRRHIAYLSFGSNVGERMEHIQNAIDALKALPSCKVCEISDIIETEPYGGVEQGKFLNGALKLETVLNPYRLLEKLHEIENAEGRVRDVRWGPRTLDLDILLYDNLVLHTKELTIPHVDMQNREFVLKPMSQIAPWLRHPLFHQTMSQMYEELV